MSRIGKKEIIVPDTVKTKLLGNKLVVSSGNLSIEVPIHPKVSIKIEPGKINIERSDDQKFSRSLHGLTRSLIANAVLGVTEGFQKKLEVIGVGYRAEVEGDKLNLKVGYSHPVEIVAPEGIAFEVKKNIITISGHDKQLVGQIAANIREVRKPEPYKGKGIKYIDEKIIRKVGKAVKGAEGKAA